MLSNLLLTEKGRLTSFGDGNSWNPMGDSFYRSVEFSSQQFHMPSFSLLDVPPSTGNPMIMLNSNNNSNSNSSVTNGSSTNHNNNNQG